MLLLTAAAAGAESRPVFRVENRKQLSCIDGKIVEQVSEQLATSGAPASTRLCSDLPAAHMHTVAMQVTFVAPVRLLLWRPIARTEVHQTVDMSDATSVRVSFNLMKSVSTAAALLVGRGGHVTTCSSSATPWRPQQAASGCPAWRVPQQQHTFPLCANIGSRLRSTVPLCASCGTCFSSADCAGCLHVWCCCAGHDVPPAWWLAL